MFGFIFGTLCLIGLVRIATRRRYGRYGYGHYGYGHFHGGGPCGGSGRFGGFGPRAALNSVLARLDTAPGQEKVITQAVADFVENARQSGRDVRDTRRTIADVLRSEHVDEARLHEVFARHDAALDRVRHAANDDEYRAGVAAFQRAMIDDPPAIFLAWSQRARAVSSRFEVPVEPGRDVLGTLRLWRPAADKQTSPD